jgi:hypothetical protein
MSFTTRRPRASIYIARFCELMIHGHSDTLPIRRHQRYLSGAELHRDDAVEVGGDPCDALNVVYDGRLVDLQFERGGID